MKKKLYLTIALLAAPAVCLATTYNIGPGRDYETLAAFKSAIPNPAPGDVIDGWNNTFNEKWTPAITGAVGNHVILYNMRISCGGVRDRAMDISTSDYITLLDINAIGECTDHGIFGAYDYFTGDALHGLRVERVNSSGHTKDGLALLTYYASRKIENVVIRDSVFDGNGAAGLEVTGQVDGVKIYNTTADGNGAVTALGAFYFGARTAHATAGWTDDGGGVYHRYIKTDDVNRGNVYRCIDFTGEDDLTENTATPTTPAAGEWGFVDATDMLYIHLPADTDPVGRDIGYAFTKCTNIRIDLSSTTNQQRPDTFEGHGVMPDDFADNVHVTRHISTGNAGAGYSFHRGTNCSLDFSVGNYNGHDGGFFGPYSYNNSVTNSTFLYNGTTGWWMAGPDDSSSLINNIMAYNGTYGISSSGSTNETVNHNLTYGNTSGHTQNVTNVDGYTVNPYLSATGKPTARSPYVVKKGGDLRDGEASIAGRWAYLGAYPYYEGMITPWNIALSVMGGPGRLGGGTVYDAPAEEYLGNYFLDGTTVFLDGSTYFVDGGL